MSSEGALPRIVIVGGGTAGWLTAATFNRALHRLAHITLIESPEVQSIGVGEATIPTLTKTLRELDIPEPEFMRRTNATFKHGILFENWMRAEGADKPHLYYHTFEKFQGLESQRVPMLAEAAAVLTGTRNPDLLGAWLRRRRRGVAGSYAHETGLQAWASDAGKAPKSPDALDYQGLANYAYHFDADQLAVYLSEVCTGRGVRHVRAHVSEIVRDAAGLICGLNTRDGQHLSGEFFVDCTGFGSHILGRTLGVPFLPYSEFLLCDRAAAIRAPHKEGAALPPYTRATALEAGWVWDINLSNRKGTGYVYSSAFLSDDEAVARLAAHIGVPPDGFEPRLIRFTPGRRSEMWMGNCAAIGLSAGFLEPLESTGIYFIEKAAALAAELLPSYLSGDKPAARFNRMMNGLYDEIRDFIVLHFHVTNREDSAFWREVRRPERAPDSLKEKLDIWSRRPPAVHDTTDTWQFFWYPSYRAILFGMDRLPTPPPQEDPAATAAADDKCAEFVSWAAAQLVDALPSHQVAIDAIASGKSEPTQSDIVERPSSDVVVELVGLGHEEDRVEATFGTIGPSESEGAFSPYERSARLPSRPWRRCELGELTAHGAAEERGWGNLVQVVKLPEAVSAPLLELGADLMARQDEGRAKLTPADVAVLNRGKVEVARLFADHRVTVRGLGVAINRPGQETTTQDNNGRWIGLHVDSWSPDISPTNRHEADNRICINIGSQPRRLLFLPVSLKSLAERLSAVADVARVMQPTEIARLAMRKWPDLPAIRLKICPGEAYIAPTENLVHDGSTADMTATDAIVTYLGRFTAKAQVRRAELVGSR